MQGARLIGPPGPHVLEEDVADDVLLFDTHEVRFVSLNSTAGDVWRLATGEFTLDEIVERLAGSCQQPVPDIEKEVGVLGNELVEAGLLQIQDRR